MGKRSMLQYMYIGWQLAVGSAVFIGAGYWLDVKTGGHWWTVGGALAGMAYCGYIICRVIKDISAEKDE
ncbi:MAG: AtpZ/AtpI family protein [Candidatus Omnitrophica bacterium]|nr:AtpZ/AtpI family protein [Candidatus Omnitrophota bacterium]